MATAKQKELEAVRKVTNATEIVNPHGGDEIAYYVSHGTPERPFYAYAYFRSNRVTKQVRQYAYTMEDMMRDVMGRYDRAAEERKAKAVHQSSGHSLEVGQVIAATFSYSASRTDFWVVEATTKHTVTMRKIGKTFVSGDWQSGTVVPVMTEATEDCTRVTTRVSVGNRVKIPNTHRSGGVWSGLPIHEYSD